MVPVVVFDAMRGVGLAVGRQPSKLIYTGSIPVPRFSRPRDHWAAMNAKTPRAPDH